MPSYTDPPPKTEISLWQGLTSAALVNGEVPFGNEVVGVGVDGGVVVHGPDVLVDDCVGWDVHSFVGVRVEGGVGYSEGGEGV